MRQVAVRSKYSLNWCMTTLCSGVVQLNENNTDRVDLTTQWVNKGITWNVLGGWSYLNSLRMDDISLYFTLINGLLALMDKASDIFRSSLLW